MWDYIYWVLERERERERERVTKTRSKHRTMASIRLAPPLTRSCVLNKKAVF